MEQRISELVKDRQAEYVLELILDGHACTRVAGLDKFENLEVLSLNGCGLVTLDGFPSLPRLSRLELADNRLKDGLSELVSAGLTNLQHLNLAGNTKLDDLEQLKPTAKLGLRSLDLYQCGITKIENYRAESFKIIPSLKYLDGTDIHGNEEEFEEDDDDGEEDGDATEQDEYLTHDEDLDEVEDEDKPNPSACGPVEDEEDDEEEDGAALGEEEDDDDDEEEEEEDDEATPLDYLLKDNLTEDEEEDEDFQEQEAVASEDDDDDDDNIEDPDNSESPTKRLKVE